jgi:ATPase family associated with various cellular activities (AAA)/Winged helix domain, variant
VSADWQTENQRALADEVARVGALLAGEEAAAATEPPAALSSLCASFGLTEFERDLLLLCAAPELDSSFPLRRATFAAALAALPGAHWTALTPAGPLRRWRLVEIGAADTLAESPLRIDERVLHYLVGVSYPDPRVEALVAPVPPVETLPRSHAEVAERAAALVASDERPVVELVAADDGSARAVAAAAAAALDLRLFALRATDVPAAPVEREALARLIERESVLGGLALLVETAHVEAGDEHRAAAALVDDIAGVIFVTGGGLASLRRPSVRLDLPRPTFPERADAWRRALGPLAAQIDGGVEALAAEFDAGPGGARGAIAATAGQADPVAALRAACRARGRRQLDALAQRIEPAARWEGLVLPERERAMLHEIAAHVRNRITVHESWGFAAAGGRGLGVTALFAGPSGTGKTMAAELLAAELDLDLYRIDLSRVVSKYIGETEKNLRRVFDAAENGGVILLFDEADALFGKRTEVKDSHDRYANIEVGYLLQRMEAFSGLAILTTNAKDALDTAFLRRLRFVVRFPFPDAEQREEIWRRIYPAAVPTDELDPAQLALLTVSGGSIRGIALNAAFLAADDGEPVRMAHLGRAARTEYAKLEKPAIEAELGGVQT